MGRIAPFLATIQPFSKAVSSYSKEVPFALYGPHLKRYARIDLFNSFQARVFVGIFY
jgi:hypothetical protein